MKDVFVSLEKQEYLLKSRQENIELMLYCLVGFAVPFFFGNGQLMVGTVVNCALVLAALNLRGWKLLPIIILPNIAVILSGIVFGPFNPSILLLAPFIWVGNAILVFGMKELFLKRKVNRFETLGIGAVLKAIFLFSAASLLVFFGLVPSLVMGAMGVFQLYTAIAGGLFALGIQEAKKRVVTA